jgi:hypothetical protein
MSRVDPRQHVRPQQRLRVAAAHINSLNSLMSPNTSFGGGPLGMTLPAQNVIYCRNDSGSDVAVGQALAIKGVLFDPTSGNAALATFRESIPVVGGVATAEHAKQNTFCIAVEPIKSGKIGRVAVAGAVAVKANVRDVTHSTIQIVSGGISLQTAGSGGVQVLWKPESTGDGAWCVVRLGSGRNSLRLCKTGSTAWSKDTIRTLDVWENGTPGSESQTTGETVESVVNKYANLQANKFCSVAEHGNGVWYVVAAEC